MGLKKQNHGHEEDGGFFIWQDLVVATQLASVEREILQQTGNMENSEES